MGDVPKRTAYIWKYSGWIMSQRYVNHHYSNYYRWAWNQVQKAALAGHLLIEIIRFCSSPVHAWDDNLCRFWLVSERTEPAECRLRTEMDAMDSIVTCTCNACGTIQLLRHMLPPCIFQPNYIPISICLCWTRGTGEIRLLRVYRFGVGSIFRWWCTWYIAYESILNW